MRSLRVAVASRVDAAAVGSEIDQQIRSVRRSTAFVDHRKLMTLGRDFGTLRDAIAGPLADLDPAAALSRMLDFIALAPSVFERSDDDGLVGDEFRTGCETVATLLGAHPAGPGDRRAGAPRLCALPRRRLRRHRWSRRRPRHQSLKPRSTSPNS